MITFWRVVLVLLLAAAAAVFEIYWWNLTGWKDTVAPVDPVVPSVVVPPLPITEQPKEDAVIVPLAPKTKIKG